MRDVSSWRASRPCLARLTRTALFWPTANLPGLRDGVFQSACAGIRPKIHGLGTATADFRIDAPDAHGVAGQAYLFGNESPGPTSSFIISHGVALRLG